MKDHVFENKRAYCPVIKASLYQDGPKCLGCSAPLFNYRVPTFQELIAEYKYWYEENRRLRNEGDRSINARIADDTAHGAGQDILNFLSKDW